VSLFSAHSFSAPLNFTAESQNPDSASQKKGSFIRKNLLLLNRLCAERIYALHAYNRLTDMSVS
jgi:hypothetical protein